MQVEAQALSVGDLDAVEVEEHVEGTLGLVVVLPPWLGVGHEQGQVDVSVCDSKPPEVDKSRALPRVRVNDEVR